MIVFPNAKINIGLNVVSRRPDGYHNLKTILFPVRICDALEMAETGKTGITFSGIIVDGAPEDNLVMKAYRLLKQKFDLPPVQFHLHKNIPPKAGLGGGSADGVFTLKMLNQFYKLNLNFQTLKDYAAKLGADCPFFLVNTPVVASGIGDEMEPVKLDLSKYKIVILKPDVSVNTAMAYRNIIPKESLFDLKDLQDLPLAFWKKKVVNDFENSVFNFFPEIEYWKNILYKMGALYASMSGSGSAVFGIFENCENIDMGKIPKSILLTR